MIDEPPPYRALPDPYAPAVVPRVRTPLTASALREALCAGHLAALSAEPPPARLACAWAMLVEEHGVGPRAAEWNNNLGNIDAGPLWTGDEFELRAREVIGGEERWLVKLLRAHPSAEEGAADYWRFLSAERFAAVLDAFDAGDPAGAAHRLSEARYFTGSVVAYAAAMSALYLEYARRWPAPP